LPFAPVDSAELQQVKSARDQDNKRKEALGTENADARLHRTPKQIFEV
jgi:hypothetical protein